MAIAESTEPTVSKRPAWSSRELPTTRSVTTRDTAANSTGMAKSHGHVK